MAQTRVLVVYYSRTGNTRRVAQEMASALGADLEELQDRKNRSGLLGFLRAGLDAARKRTTEIAPLQHDASAYDLVVVGTPVWAATLTPAVRTFFKQHRERLRAVAFFLTTGGSGIRRTFSTMAALAGKTPLARLSLTAAQLAKGDVNEPLGAFVATLRAGMSGGQDAPQEPAAAP